VRLAVGRWPDVWRDGMGGRTGRLGGMWWPDGKVRGGEGRGGEGKTGPMGGGWAGGGLARRERGVARRDRGVARRGGVARQDGMECRTGICGGRTGWKGVRTKGKGETGSLDHVCMRYVGSCGASSRSSSVESSVLSSSSCSGNPLRRCRTSFLMTILLIR
jgi:hypothetical protein